MFDGPILVVGAHADDEVLGAGGTMALARRASCDVHVLILSTSCNSREPRRDVERTLRQNRRRDAAAVAARLSASLSIEDFSDNGFDAAPSLQLVAAVERIAREVRPAVVMTHWPGDLSLDHRATAHAVLTACRPQGLDFSPTILSFEIRSSTDWMPGPAAVAFQPTVFVPIDDEAWSTKLALLELYRTELRAAPHARSLEGIDAMARFRGTQIGCPRAEAFALLRQVVRP